MFWSVGARGSNTVRAEGPKRCSFFGAFSPETSEDRRRRPQFNPSRSVGDRKALPGSVEPGGLFLSPWVVDSPLVPVVLDRLPFSSNSGQGLDSEIEMEIGPLARDLPVTLFGLHTFRCHRQVRDQ